MRELHCLKCLLLEPCVLLLLILSLSSAPDLGFGSGAFALLVQLKMLPEESIMLISMSEAH